MAFQGGSRQLRTNYGAVLETATDFLGIDPVTLVNLSLVIAGLSTFFHYLGGTVYRQARKVCISSVHINEDDALYAYLMRWMTDFHLQSKAFRTVKATTPTASTWEDEEEATKFLGDDFDVDKIISYRTIMGRVPIKLAPFEGSNFFRHNGRWMLFSHSVHKGSLLTQSADLRERGYVTVQCFGRSMAPLQTLLEDVQRYALEKTMSTTNIFRGVTNFRERMGWSKVISRPSRDIRTVILAREKKTALLTDINEYLHPRSRRWYANHGIPYRRGYLFSGEPGTGKSSLTAALAGVFGLDIYVLSLLDSSLNESQLMRLLSEVPSRCIVLLEDVDAAGLNRPALQDSSGRRGRTAAKGASAEEGIPNEHLHLAPLAAPPATSISLSGLLNAIDGVSSHEGRVLIMTTNAPEELDVALIRPGRVDMHIAFELPHHAEMRELFLSMYRDVLPMGGNEAGKTANGAANGSLEKMAASLSLKEQKKETNDGEKENMISTLGFEASDELLAMADRFANALPEAKLSLASIQGYLLRYKGEPELACGRVREWAEQATKGQTNVSKSE